MTVKFVSEHINLAISTFDHVLQVLDLLAVLVYGTNEVESRNKEHDDKAPNDLVFVLELLLSLFSRKL